MFKEKIIKHFKENKIDVLKVEQMGDVESIVCHITESNNAKVEEIREKMEEEFNVAIIQSSMYGMNTVIVESNNLE